MTFDEKKCDMTCFNTGCMAPAVLTEMILPTPSALKLSMFSLKSIRENQKEPPRYKRGGHWVNLFLLIAGFVVTCPAVWLNRLNPERIYFEGDRCVGWEWLR